MSIWTAHMRRLILAFCFCLLPLSVHAAAMPACSTLGNALMWDSTSGFTCQSSPQVPSTVVGSLPTCNAGAAGKIYLVTDALTPVALAAAVGNGAVVVSVVCTGSAWLVQ